MRPKPKLFAVGELKTILSSEVLRKILQQSAEYQQDKLNQAVRKQDWDNASYHLGRLDYINKFFDIVQLEYDKLTKEEKNG